MPCIRIKNSLLHIAVLLLSCAVTAGCIRENLSEDCDNIPGLGADEYGICFELSLENFGGAATRADSFKYENGDEIDNYVNSRNMRVLFFDTDDNYICDLLTDTEACTVFDVSDGNVRRWYVGITLSKLGDFEDDIKELISTHGFKIAVFANWDKRSALIPDYTIRDLAKGSLGYIAHCLPDQTYSSGVSDEGVEHTAYTHIVGTGGTMGAWYDWVENHFSDKYEVDRLIRSGGPMKTAGSADALGGTGNDAGIAWFYEDTSTPTEVFCNYDLETGENIGKGFWYSRKERDDAVYTYKNIWTVWDFSGGEAKPVLNRGEFTNVWKDINSHLPEAFETAAKTFNGLTFVPENSSYTGSSVTLKNSDIYWDGNFVYANNKAKAAGIGHNSLETTKEYLHFKAETDGSLYIQAEGNGYIGIHLGELFADGNEKNALYKYFYTIDSAKPVYDGSGNIIGGGITIDVTDAPLDIYIFAQNGDVTITEMEFIKDRYLFDTDRIGKQPDIKNQLGIPMYGIQEFGPVGEYWLPGEYFNVSRDTYNSLRKDGYQYRPIWMLRSVAKVELRVSKALGGAHQSVKPSSVYMRSMNRSSRYEPKDFSTPTNLIWYGSEYYKDDKDYQYENEDYSGIVGINEEVKNIEDHGIIYVPKSDDEDKVDDDGWSYRQFTSWYYGIWEDILNWTWNGQPDIDPDADDGNPYPRVFNARVARSDYARFIDGGEDGGYWYYYLYMPEKNIDDADDTGDRSVRPKVAHIELRFEDTETGEVFNNDDNLDDNHAYRIYFTENGRFGSGVGRDEYDRNGSEHLWDDGAEDYYEDYVEGLEKHWPVVRNTIYRFTLNGLNSTDITVEVCGAASRKIDIEFK